MVSKEGTTPYYMEGSTKIAQSLNKLCQNNTIFLALASETKRNVRVST